MRLPKDERMAALREAAVRREAARVAAAAAAERARGTLDPVEARIAARSDEIADGRPRTVLGDPAKHFWACARCAVDFATTDAPVADGDGKFRCGRCRAELHAALAEDARRRAEDAARPAATREPVYEYTPSERREPAQAPGQRAGIVATAGVAEEPQTTKAEERPGASSPPPHDVPTPTTGRADVREGEAQAGSSKPGHQTTKEEKPTMSKTAKRGRGGCTPLAEPWKCPGAGCGFTATTKQGKAIHIVRRHGGAEPSGADPVSPPPAAEAAKGNGESQGGNGAKPPLLATDPPAPPPSWAPPLFALPQYGGPARPAGITATVGGIVLAGLTVDDAVALVRAVQAGDGAQGRMGR